MRRLVPAIGAVAILALVAGATLGLLLAPVAAPPSLAPTTGLASMTPVELPFADEIRVPFALSSGALQALRSPASGVLTSFACTDGGQATSGAVIMTVDARAVIGLSTRIPLWRTLEHGDEGADVEALQAELSRLGHDVPVDGYWGWASADAYSAMRETAGAPDEDMALASIMWLPAPAATTTTCLVSVGSGIGAGTPVAELPVSLSSASARGNPSGAIEGPRMVVVDGQQFPLPDNGIVTDPVALASMLTSSAYATAKAEGDTSTVAYPVSLATPITVTVLAPGSIVAVDGDHGCVLAGTTPVGVTIVGSRLGQSFVVPARALQEVSLTPDPATRCAP